MCSDVSIARRDEEYTHNLLLVLCLTTFQYYFYFDFSQFAFSRY